MTSGQRKISQMLDSAFFDLFMVLDNFTRYLKPKLFLEVLPLNSILSNFAVNKSGIKTLWLDFDLLYKTLID